MAAWTVFLAVLAFCLALLGTFLVRSGVITSVHAFGETARGGVLLFGLAAAGAFALALFAWRAPLLKAGPEFDPVSREGALVLNNLFLSVGAALVLVGTVTPMFAQALNVSLSIGEPYFRLTFAPMMAVLLLFMPLAPAMPWRKAELTPMIKRFWPAAALAVVAAVSAYVLWPKSLWLAFGVFVGAWVIAGMVMDLIRRVGPGGLGRLTRLPLAVWGMTIAHVGIGMFVIGATVEAANSQQTFPLHQGEEASAGGWTFRFDGVRDVEGPNYQAIRADILVTHEDGTTEVIHPEKRFYPVANTSTTEVAIRRTLRGHVYVALGDTIREEPGVWRIQVGQHPLLDWVFGGAGLIALGGFIALAARIRRRAPVTKEAAAVEPATGEQPAGATA
jgi:cytochrome c-type biogenesis protein CcmF